uniref:PX domain-containing protein n=2 Tax=Auxenochlorella protothecoides TaxID=3075 RepID=A0A1D2AAG2_AUXPR
MGTRTAKAWRYTLRLPSWSLAELPDGDSSVFYQMEVTVIPPDGPPRRRSVGRRFSNFTTLHQKLQEELGPATLTALDPPPKKTLAWVNQRPDLIEQRRWELEQWLWRLTEVPSIANSSAMYAFCELDTTARAVTRTPVAGLAPRSHSLASPSLSGSAGPGEVSGLREGSGNMAGAELDRQGSAQQGQGRDGDLASVSGSRDLGPRLQSTGSASPPALAKARQETGPRSEGSAHAQTPVLDRGEARHRLRMTLHVEERARLSAMVETLRRALVTAHADLHDAARCIQTDQAAIASLAAQVAERGGGGAADDDVEAVRAELETERRQRRAAEDALREERARLTARAAEDAAAGRTALEAELRMQRTTADAAAEASASALEECEGRLRAQTQAAAAAAAKARADQKLLAREIKSLRARVSELEGRRAGGGADVAWAATAAPPVIPQAAASDASPEASEASDSAVAAALGALRAELGRCSLDDCVCAEDVCAVEARLATFRKRLEAERASLAGCAGPRAPSSRQLADVSLSLTHDAAAALTRSAALLRGALGMASAMQGLEERVTTPALSPTKQPGSGEGHANGQASLI